MKINTSEKYEELAAEWQFQILKVLREKMLKHGVPVETAKEICGEFAFDIAMLQDQGEIKSNGIEYRPVICFDDLVGELYYNSDEQFQLHDYAFGNNDEVFESQ